MLVMYSLFLHSHKPKYTILYNKTRLEGSHKNEVNKSKKSLDTINVIKKWARDTVVKVVERVKWLISNDTKTTWDDPTIITESEWSETIISEENLESNNILREQTVVSIGDLHGNYGAFLWNLTSSWLIDSENHWIGWNTKVIFHGDIFADRHPYSIDIAFFAITLQQEAKLHGGELIFLAWNHEDIAFAYLTRQSIYYNNKKVSEIWIDSFSSAIWWLMELEHLFDPTITIDKVRYHNIRENLNTIQNELNLETNERKKIMLQIRINKMQENLKEAENELQWETVDPHRKNLLNEMRLDPKWRQILEFLCNMKLINQTDDTLRIHVPPHPALLELVLEKWVDTINSLYQKWLQYYYLNNGDLNLFEKIEFIKLRKIFLDTGHREIENNPIYEELMDKWITKIMYGHNEYKSVTKYDNNWVTLYWLDYWYWKDTSWNDKNKEWKKRDLGGRKKSDKPIFTKERRNEERMTSVVIVHRNGTIEFGDKSRHTP